MLLFTLFQACTQDPPPVAGHLSLCIPQELLSSSMEEGIVEISGTLQEIREGTGSCTAEIVMLDEVGEEYVLGYSIVDPEGNDATVRPSWENIQNARLSLYTQMSFGYSSGIILEDTEGLLLALEEGFWSGALTNAELPFSVEWSETEVGTMEGECSVTIGYLQHIGDMDMSPFGSYDITVDGRDFSFVSIGAMKYGPGENCSISDISDQFSWAIFRK